MPPKPLINENLLQKITKAPPFHIRSKHTPLKPAHCSKSLKNIEIASPINKQLELCIELVNQQLQNTPFNNRDFLQRIAKLLIELKTKWQPIEQPTLQTEPEQYQMTPQVLRKISSKYFSKNRLEIAEQPRFVEGNFFTDKSTAQLKKNKLSKLKIGKENNERLIATHEIKLEKLTSKLEQTKNTISEHKAEIERLKQQIQSLALANQQLKSANLEGQQEIQAINEKLKCLSQQKLTLECEFEDKMRAIERKNKQSAGQCVVLRGQLEQRQRQIAALWQLPKF